ncbi:MAG: quinone-dependent dihydroorotate dehydrogenase [Bacteroidales bacterium]
MYKSIIRPLLFKINAESIHDNMVSYLSVVENNKWARNLVCKLFESKNKQLEKQVDSLYFINPVGLSAGFDKNGEIVDALACFGFGFIEIGTVTPLPQTGNPSPRIFRLPEDEALISRTGYNNQGVEHILERIRNQHRYKHLTLGVNINKNDDTPPDKAWDDFKYCFEAFYGYADYFTINVPYSADILPDDPSLEWFRKVLYGLVELRTKKTEYRPVFLKVPADFTNEQLLSTGYMCLNLHIDGIIATGPGMKRENMKSTPQEITAVGNGGLCGHPLKEKSLHAIRLLKSHFPNKLTLIGAGGILDENDAVDMLNAGADLIQVYSAFIYNGPEIIKRMKHKILDNSLK